MLSLFLANDALLSPPLLTSHDEHSAAMAEASTSRQPFNDGWAPAIVISDHAPADLSRFDTTDAALDSHDALTGTAAASSSAAPYRSQRAGLGLQIDWSDTDATYGPTTRRKGPLRFVRAIAASEGVGDSGYESLEQCESGDRKVERRAMDKEELESADSGSGQTERVSSREGTAGVRSIYERIVLARASASTTTPPAAQKRARQSVKQEPARKEPPASSRRQAEVIYVTDSDSDEDEATREGEEVTERAVTVFKPPERTRVPDPFTPWHQRKATPRTIHELLATATPSDGNSDDGQPYVPPVYYGIKETSKGWKMLARQGWTEGEALGPVREETRKALLVPIRPVEKQDRKGLGNAVERKRERAGNEREEARHPKVKGGRDRAHVQSREQEKRRAMLAYMNR